MTHVYTYRGVTYTKQAGKNTTVKNTRIEKIYRGAAYFKLPKIKHHLADHVYRGVQFVA